MRSNKRGAAMALAAAIASFAAAAMPAHAQDSTVKIGYFAQLHDAALLSLKDSLGGKYKLEYVKFQRYADAAIALTRGDIQITSLGYASLITDASRGGQQKIFFVSGLARGAINLVCRKDVKIEKWADLKGKSIGVVSGFPEIFLDDAVGKHGGNPADLRKVNFAVAGPPVLQALKDKTTDCASVFEPFGATAVSEGYAYYPRTDLIDNSFLGINNGVAVNAEFLQANRPLIQDVVNGVVAATANYRQSKSAWVTQMVKSQGIPGPIVTIGVDRVVLDNALYKDQAWTLAGNMKKQGLIKGVASRETLDGYFDPSFLAAVPKKK